MAGVFQAFMPDLVTLTGGTSFPGLHARPGHTIGWHETSGTRRVARDGWHETDGTRRVARVFRAVMPDLVTLTREWTRPNPIVERQSGGLVLVQFLAGKLCSLSLNGFSVHFLAVGCAF